MEESSSKTYIGKIKAFNGQFGFITSELGDTFFHKTELEHDFVPQKYDEVEFQIKPSRKKAGMVDACKLILIKKGEKEEKHAANEKYLLGTVKWFSTTKGYGFISAGDTDYFIHASNFLSITSIAEGNIVIFKTKFHKGRLSAIKCQLFIDGLSESSPEGQTGLLQQYLSDFGSISSDLEYAQIELIAEFDKMEETVKDVFLKSAFEKANSEYQYRMFSDGLIGLSEEEQSDLLQQYLSELGNISFSNYERIQSIAQSDRITASVKDTFLKSAFEKAYSEYQYKMLFEDNLIDIQKETAESQSDLLRKYLSELGNISFSNYERIQSIAQSDRITASVKDTFLKSTFEKANSEYQYKMLFEDNLIDVRKETAESQTDLLQQYLSKLGRINHSNYERIQSIAQSDKITASVKDTFLKSAFEKAYSEYQYKMLFEDNLIDIQEQTDDNQVHLLQQIGLLTINQIRSIAQSDKIGDNVKGLFLKSAFEKANSEYQYKMLFEDNLIDIQKETAESQTDLLQQYLSKLGRINHSNYERIQSIAQSDKITASVKDTFLKSAFEKIDTEYLYKMLFEDNLIDIQKETTESQADLLQQYLSKLGHINYSNYVRIQSIVQSDRITASVKDTFLKSVFEKADTEYQYKMFSDGLIDLSEEGQSDLLEQYLSKLGHIKYSNYERIQSIAQSDRITATVKDTFLKSVFEKANADCQYKMLFEDNLIEIQEQTDDNQVHLLQQTGSLNINQIRSIAQSDKIDDNVKDLFLKSAFEKTHTEYQYKMLFEDNLIDIQKETPEKQYDLLRKYLSKLGHVNDSNYQQVKAIAQSDKIDNSVKDTFIKSAYKRARDEYKHEILFVDCLIDVDFIKKLDFLLDTTKTGLNTFAKGKYVGQKYFDVMENDLSYYQWYANSSYYKSSSPSLRKYNQLKEIWISILEEILKNLRCNFKSLNMRYIFRILKNTTQIQELLIVFHIDHDNELFNKERIQETFDKEYSKMSEINRLYFWLLGINFHYNYFEFVKAAWQLSNDERKLFNKRLKEHAKDERLQKFLDQIPTAKLAEETESSKTYRCKWRNLYYKQGAVQVFLDKTTATHDYCWEPSREEWNLLTQEYFNNRRVEDIIVTVDNNNHITGITGLDDIEVKIIIAEVRKNGTTERKTNISTSQVTRIIHNVAARFPCIHFLSGQESGYEVLDIQELVTDDYGAPRRDISFLFPIPDDNDNVYLIWESTEFEKSKATHIFKCKKNMLEEIENKIKEFIENNMRTRSRLNSVENDDLQMKRELQYFCRVNHDMVDYQVWEDRMKTILPFLK